MDRILLGSRSSGLRVGAHLALGAVFSGSTEYAGGGLIADVDSAGYWLTGVHVAWQPSP